MKQTLRIFKTLAAVATVALLGACQETMEISSDTGLDFPVPEGEIPFILSIEEVGNAGTRSEVWGEPSSTLTGEAIQMLCFDQSGYYMGIRQGYIKTSNTPAEGSSPSVPGVFAGHVPIGTARVHFVANAHLPDPMPFTIGSSENVVMHSKTLSSFFVEENPSVKFWGYKRFNAASDMQTWLAKGVPTQANPNPTPNKVMLLRDRARITLSFDEGVLNGYSVRWTVFNGRDRGYIAPYDGNLDNPWENYDMSVGNVPVVPMTEYAESGRYTIYDHETHTETATWSSSGTAQYVFDDSNIKTSSGEDGRVRIILEVTNTNTNTKKYLLLLMRDTSGEQIQITRNHTYNFHITSLSRDGYATLERATDPSAGDYANAPADVDPGVPSVSDGNQILELLEPGSTVIVRQQGATVPVAFTFKNIDPSTGALSDPYENVADATALDDFVIEWEENDQSNWVIGTPVHTADSDRPWKFNLTIGTIGSTYAFEDYLIIRHRRSGLSRSVHVYAVDQFRYRVNPSLVQVTNADDSPYLGPSGDDAKSQVFKLSFKLPESLHDDLFPLDIRIATSTLEPYGDKSTGYQTRLSGGFGVQTASTAYALDGSTLASGADKTDWNYKSREWNFWLIYTLDEYPEDGEVVIYLKDIRDAYDKVSNQGVGLYLDIEDFSPAAVSIASGAIQYPTYEYGTSGNNAGEYTVPKEAARYRASISGCPAGSYTLSTPSADTWLSVDPTSITLDAAGRLDFVFSVAQNTATQRDSYVTVHNVTANVDTQVHIIQEAGTNSTIVLRAASTEVKGDVTVVNLTVYCEYPWELTTTNPDGAFSFTGPGDPHATLSGTNTGSGGQDVKFIMPINFTENSISYVITATDTKPNNGGQDTDTKTITQRGGTIYTNQTVVFSAEDYRKRYPRSTSSDPAMNAFVSKLNGDIVGTFDRLYGYNDATENVARYDITRDNVDETATLLLEITHTVIRITEVEFRYYHDWVSFAPTSWSSNPNGTFSSQWRDNLTTTTLRQTWTPANNVEVTDQVEFTLTNTTDPIAFKHFIVTFDRIVWE